MKNASAQRSIEGGDADTSRTPNLDALRQAVLWPVGLVLVVRTVKIVGYVMSIATGTTIHRTSDPFLAIPAINKVLQGAGVASHAAFLVFLAGTAVTLLWKFVLPMRERVLLGGLMSICLCEACVMLVYSLWSSSEILLGLYVLDICLCLGVILTATLGKRPTADSNHDEE